jgi:hypothetical protein
MGKEKLIYIPLLIGARNDIAEKIGKSGLRIGYGGGRVPWRFHQLNGWDDIPDMRIIT